MLYLNKNTNNKIVVTLDSDTVLTGLSTSYSITLQSQTTVPITYSLGSDTSAYKSRYNLFYLTGSTFTAQPDGYYNYNIYNSAYSAITLETGKAILTSTTFTSIVYKDTRDTRVDTTRKIYSDNRN